MTNSCYIFISEKPTTPGIDTLCIISARIEIEGKLYLHQCCDVVLSSWGELLKQSTINIYIYKTTNLISRYISFKFIHEEMIEQTQVNRNKDLAIWRKTSLFFIRIIQIIIKWSECLNFSFRIEHTSNTISAWDGDLHLCI